MLDNAAGRLTTADIRSRELGRGLGLISDLVARHDGSIVVEPPGPDAPGFEKAVVVRLPRADTADSDGPLPAPATVVAAVLDDEPAAPGLG